jgi:drug/metabolite transporter (DMT)-like permease
MDTARPDPAAERRQRRLGYASAVAVLFLWVGFLLTARLSQKQDMTPWDIAALRYGGAFLGAAILAAWFGLPRLPPWRMAAVVATAAFGFPLFAYHGFALAPAAHGAVLNAGMLPFYTAILGILLLNERFTRWRAISLGVVGTGIALLGFDTLGRHPGAWRGDLLFCAGSFSWALYTVLVRRWRLPALPATIGAALWSGPIFLAAWWFFLPSTLAAVPVSIAAFHLFYQGFLAVLASGYLFTLAVTSIGPQRTTAITAFVPVVAALAAWPLLDEPLGLAGLLGVVIVSGGIILAVRTPAR